MLYWVPSPSVNNMEPSVVDVAFNVLMHTVVYADPLEDQLRNELATRHLTFLCTYFCRVLRIDRRGLLTVSTGRVTGRDQLTKKMGCFKANFSTPPLMMLVLNVMIPAWKPHQWGQDETTENAHHFNGATEGQLRSVRSDYSYNNFQPTSPC